MPELAHMKTLGTITLPMPSLSKPNQAAKIIPAAQASVKVLARLKGFAESLDDLVPDVVPVMPRVRQAVVVDPLPW
ncbi:hypothetical protein ACI77M_06620 [Pseudomonas fildesensis]|uniref:hypothetical protein n=1 Tax=Pseudomonas fildesensis TaxID=1674920 RepID=UPI00387AA846